MWNKSVYASKELIQCLKLASVLLGWCPIVHIVRWVSLLVRSDSSPFHFLSKVKVLHDTVAHRVEVRFRPRTALPRAVRCGLGLDWTARFTARCGSPLLSASRCGSGPWTAPHRTAPCASLVISTSEISLHVVHVSNAFVIFNDVLSPIVCCRQCFLCTSEINFICVTRTATGINERLRVMARDCQGANKRLLKSSWSALVTSGLSKDCEFPHFKITINQRDVGAAWRPRLECDFLI